MVQSLFNDLFQAQRPINVFCLSAHRDSCCRFFGHILHRLETSNDHPRAINVGPAVKTVLFFSSQQPGRRFSNIHYISRQGHITRFPVIGDGVKIRAQVRTQERCLRHLSICPSLSNMLQQVNWSQVYDPEDIYSELAAISYLVALIRI